MRLVKKPKSWLAILLQGLLFLMVWVVLTDGDMSSWWIGVPAVLLAMIAGVALIPPVPLVWHEVIRFIIFFMVRSLMAGADVAWRALNPRMPIAPALIDYPLRISPGLPQVFMANTVSLLPGTLSADLVQSVLKVHVLDKEKDFMAELESVERHVARMFGISLNSGNGGS